MPALTGATVRATIAVSDRTGAKAFYGETLGLVLESDNPAATTYRCAGGTMLDVYESEFAGSAKSTVASFQVDDLDTVMRDLRGRGIAFEEYDQGELRTSNGVAEVGGIRGAWFRDPDGNVLGLVQLTA